MFVIAVAMLFCDLSKAEDPAPVSRFGFCNETCQAAMKAKGEELTRICNEAIAEVHARANDYNSSAVALSNKEYRAKDSVSLISQTRMSIKSDLFQLENAWNLYEKQSKACTPKCDQANNRGKECEPILKDMFIQAKKDAEEKMKLACPLSQEVVQQKCSAYVSAIKSIHHINLTTPGRGPAQIKEASDGLKAKKTEADNSYPACRKEQRPCNSECMAVKVDAASCNQVVASSPDDSGSEVVKVDEASYKVQVGEIQTNAKNLDAAYCDQINKESDPICMSTISRIGSFFSGPAPVYNHPPRPPDLAADAPPPPPAAAVVDSEPRITPGATDAPPPPGCLDGSGRFCLPGAGSPAPPVVTNPELPSVRGWAPTVREEPKPPVVASRPPAATPREPSGRPMPGAAGPTADDATTQALAKAALPALNQLQQRPRAPAPVNFAQALPPEENCTTNPRMAGCEQPAPIPTKVNSGTEEGGPKPKTEVVEGEPETKKPSLITQALEQLSGLFRSSALKNHDPGSADIKRDLVAAGDPKKKKKVNPQDPEEDELTVSNGYMGARGGAGSVRRAKEGSGVAALPGGREGAGTGGSIAADEGGLPSGFDYSRFLPKNVRRKIIGTSGHTEIASKFDDLFELVNRSYRNNGHTLTGELPGVKTAQGLGL